jgi:preprotein translocase subunit SecY
MSILMRLWKTKQIRMNILYVLAMLVLFRVAAHVPIPGADASAIRSLFDGGNSFFGLLNIFSGGTLQNFSVVALGVAPYITSSIIFQLLAMIIPAMEEMQKDESGRQKISQYTRYATVPLAALQGYALISLLSQQTGGQLFLDPSIWTYFISVLSMTAGTVFLMWVGELITEKGIGNGISILILAGIIAGFPTFLQQMFAVYDATMLVTIILFTLFALLTVVVIVVMNEAMRIIPVRYARQVRGSRLAGSVNSHIPLKLNMGGVIPIIFAISIVLFPSMIAQFFVNANTEILRDIANWVLMIFQNQLFYGIFYFVLVFVFTYFYTAVIFHPDKMAENLQRSGGFIPGIRPGANTAEYLGNVANRLLLTGATFLSMVAVLPVIVQQFTGSANMIIGGTSILIIVAVVIDSVKQVESQLMMYEYEI